ncbi:18205_t:CDS:2 [Funneliformis geosporum]|uniref:13251_t:CDS:1 n=1 Tax=Funneliformis geosporum TaxID=1117311 RepID=A0A9W4SZ82_9GLOM|nr:13251_t:CDS:2 [Funneliformis geosporum]CAI2186928.1 18205_t:CDS:2 [Funneliformis geosporum]
MKFFFENTLFAFLILYLRFIKPIKANIEKEVFTSNAVKISESLFKEISEWSEQGSLLTLTPPYTIKRYEQIVPFKSVDEFSQDKSGEKEKWYILDDLEEGKTYETRVSYAATSPTTFVLEIMGFEEAANIFEKRKNLEIPQSNSQPILTTTKKLLRVRAIYEGVSIIPGRESRPIIYNIVLETLTYGVPRVAFKLVLTLALILGIGYYICVPMFYSSLQKLIKVAENNKDLNRELNREKTRIE